MQQPAAQPTYVGFYPISPTERVEIIRTASGDYEIRLMVDGAQAGNTRGAYGPGLVGWQNAQTAARSWANGIKRDHTMVAR